jgi:hypothetical protein
VRTVKKFKPVRAWAGLCNGTLYFSRQSDNYRSASAVVAEVYKSEREAKERWEEVIEVEIRALPDARKK